ncbi:MAG: hypothetical protein ACLQQ0_11950 [Limisphaerales bacterium]
MDPELSSTEILNETKQITNSALNEIRGPLKNTGTKMNETLKCRLAYKLSIPFQPSAFSPQPPAIYSALGPKANFHQPPAADKIPFT